LTAGGAYITVIPVCRQSGAMLFSSMQNS